MSEVVDITELISAEAAHRRARSLPRRAGQAEAAEGYNHRADRRAEHSHPAPLILPADALEYTA